MSSKNEERTHHRNHSADEDDPFEALRHRLKVEAKAFAANPELDAHVGAACVRALARKTGRVAIIDHSMNRREIKAGLLLAVAWSLAARWRNRIADSRVGVVLPPGIGGTVVNLALALLGKIPVNLNFTIGRRAAVSCIRQSGLKTIITAGKLKEKYPDFPWTADCRDVVDEIKACGKVGIAFRSLIVRLAPISRLLKWIGAPSEGGEREFGLLFTSGSSGDPKGVVLTHRNVMANTLQIRSTGILPGGCSVMACLPIFHSFGFTVTMWYPLLADIVMVTYPSPLETRRLAEIIAQEKVDVLVGSATFLRPFLKRAEPEQLAGLKFAVAGAERLSDELYHAFLERFGIRIMQGYGLTETSPVVSVNHPGDPDQSIPEVARLGSVGPLIPGVEARIVSTDGRRKLSLGESGILCLRGPNIFPGYLNDSRHTAEVFRGDWFMTGDVARFDADGFLFLEGRLSRFSKIGGEMVPHVLVEEHIVRVCGWDSLDQQVAAVVGIPDMAKGESLVLLAARDIDLNDLRQRLIAAGLPNLWVPRTIRRVESIPMLATGKCDLRSCLELALE